MAIKNKQKRYIVVIEDGIETRKLISKEQLEKIKNGVNKYNNNYKNNYYFGNIEVHY